MVELYLQGQRVDIEPSTNIALTYSFSDLESPANITGDYSKEFTLKGTARNNAIFGQIWRFDRSTVPSSISNVSVHYNASKRTQAVIAVDGSVFKIGYLKLNSVKVRREVFEYKVTFYSRMCEALHTLQEARICDLPFTANLRHRLSATSVVNSWTARTGVWKYLTYIMSNSGLYEEFESSKWLTMQGTTPIVADIAGGLELDEVATREYRSYYQRPALWVKPLVELIAQQHGIELDPAFFNDRNPYYAQSVLTLPRYTQADVMEEDRAEAARFGTISVEAGTYSEPITAQFAGGQRFGDALTPTIDVTSYGASTLTVECMVKATAYLTANAEKEVYTVPAGYTEPHIRGVLAVGGNEEDMERLMPGHTTQFRGRGRVFESYYIFDTAQYRPNGVKTAAYLPTQLTASFSTDYNAAEVELSAEGMPTALVAVDGSGQTVQVERWEFEIVPIEKAPTNEGVVDLNRYYPYGDGFNGADAVFTTHKTIRSGYDVTKAEIIDEELKQGEFLIDYCKAFGLLFRTDENGRLSIVTRNTFFDGAPILDWTAKLDRTKGYDAIPLTFDVDRFVLKFAEGETFYETYYQDKTGEVYGAKTVNTGFEFDDNESDLLDGTMFTQAVMSKEAVRMLIGSQMVFRRDTRELPAFFEKDGATRNPVDVKYSLLFFNGMKEVGAGQPPVVVSDDHTLMLEDSIGGGQFCWIDTARYPEKGIRVTQYPEFSTLTNGAAWWFARPLENYAGWKPADVPNSASIYAKYWEHYMADLYNVDTRRLTAQFRLSALDVSQMTFAEFVKIDGALWHVNKIVDFNPASNGTTKVELVQVQDLDAYTEGQAVW